MQEIGEKRHITEEMWISLENDTISQKEYMQILEHTCDCTWCAERLAEILMPDDAAVMEADAAAVMPPSYLAEEILERTKQLDVQAVVTVKQTSKKVQLLLYSLKVSAAVAFSILILGITANFQDIRFIQMEQPQRVEQMSEEGGRQEERHQKKDILDKVDRAADGITKRMNEFANQILNGGKEE